MTPEVTHVGDDEQFPAGPRETHIDEVGRR